MIFWWDRWTGENILMNKDVNKNMNTNMNMNMNMNMRMNCVPPISPLGDLLLLNSP